MHARWNRWPHMVRTRFVSMTSKHIGHSILANSLRTIFDLFLMMNRDFIEFTYFFLINRNLFEFFWIYRTDSIKLMYIDVYWGSSCIYFLRDIVFKQAGVNLNRFKLFVLIYFASACRCVSKPIKTVWQILMEWCRRIGSDRIGCDLLSENEWNEMRRNVHDGPEEQPTATDTNRNQPAPMIYVWNGTRRYYIHPFYAHSSRLVATTTYEWWRKVYCDSS